MNVWWSKPPNGGDPINAYQLEHNEIGMIASQLPVIFEPAESFLQQGVVLGLSNGTTYQIRIRACNRVKCGMWSHKIEGTPTTALVANVYRHHSPETDNETRGVPFDVRSVKTADSMEERWIEFNNCNGFISHTNTHYLKSNGRMAYQSATTRYLLNGGEWFHIHESDTDLDEEGTITITKPLSTKWSWENDTRFPRSTKEGNRVEIRATWAGTIDGFLEVFTAVFSGAHPAILWDGGAPDIRQCFQVG